MMAKVVDINDHKRQVSHDLCTECPKNESCSDVCIAIEVLTQLCLAKGTMKKLEYIDNIATRLDLENSFDKIN